MARHRAALTQNAEDLAFILRQIEIAEAHADGGSLASLVRDPLLPYGLRTVSGRFNNIVPGQEPFGSADRLFPRLAPPVFRAGEAATFDPDGPGPLGPGSPSSYAQNSGIVFDSQPRLISRLIADQTADNPAAVAAATQTSGSEANVDGRGTFFIPNVAPDLGLSAPFNGWFILFGQFFDHGLDLVQKGGSGAVFIPLQPDDPLFVDGGTTNFMVLTRATNQPGPDGVLGTADDVHEHRNTTTPFVDQNQTYTSHPSHQVFLREYVLDASGRPVATGRLLENARGGIGTWADVKAQAADKLGIALSDQDVFDVPLLATDEYGRFLRGPNGFAQLVTPSGLVEGNPAAPISTAGALRTGHAFLDDIAHAAVPSPGLVADPDAIVTPSPQPPGTYDDELLAAHFCTGDGRGNENIGLTAVHNIFHAEHNRLVDQVKSIVLGTNNPIFIAQWLVPGANQADGVQPLEWNGERLFQAARFGTEMQYQHIVFEEFARKVQPEVNAFAGYDTTIDSAIFSEFAHTVYRFGHSMLTETIARTHADGGSADVSLIRAFLNPLEFGAGTANDREATAAVARGMTRQVGNEIDEFVTSAVRNNLLGLPLDLATINLARGRDTGIPPLNAARRTFFAATGNSALRPYTSWADYGLALRHPESLVNFVAAYGTHPTIASATTLEAKRAAAAAIVEQGPSSPPDAADFMNATGAWANAETGINLVDFWIGGLAEKQMIFGGLLGPTFNFVFETQMERLQDGDRLYYLSRTVNLNFLTQLEQGSFSELVMRNTGLKHLPGDIFSRPAFTFEMGNVGNAGPIVDDPSTEWDESQLLVRMPDGTVRYTGVEHVVMGGTAQADRMRASEGDDTIWGDEGDDAIEGGDGNDLLHGGDGDDIITDLNGIDTLKGGDGDDVMNAGPGNGDLLLGGAGSDFIVGGADFKEVMGGQGGDFIASGDSADIVFGGEGDDWIEGGDQADLLQGDNGDPFQVSPIAGNDVLLGQGGNDDYDSESGDDIMVSDFGVERHEGMLGFDWVTYQGAAQPVNADMRLTGLLPPDINDLRDRFDLVEGLSGYDFDDVLRGDDRDSVDLTNVNANSGFNHALNGPAQISLIDGLAAILPPGATSFAGGNILLGGRGSDELEGRGGDDIIDGDAWLEVWLSVRDGNGVEIGRAQRMAGILENKSGALAGTPADLTLQAAMFQRLVKPGSLRIVRRIATAPDSTAVDVAVYSEPLANYDVTRNADGTITVSHARPLTNRTDGRDVLRNIEQIRFADQTIATSSITTPTDVFPPGPVVALAVSIGDTEVVVSFIPPADAATVRVLRSTVGFATSPLQTVNQTVVFDGAGTFVRDRGLVNDTTYFYTVFARDAAGNFSTPATIQAVPRAGAVAVEPANGNAPAAVTSLVQTSGDAEVELSWTNPPDAVAVRVLRSSIGFATLPTDQNNQAVVFDAPGTRFRDTGLVNGTTYFYTLFARDALGRFSPPATINARPVDGSLFADTTPPGPVTNLVQMTDDGEVTLTWVNPPDAAAVRILRSVIGYAQSPTDTIDQVHVFDEPGVRFTHKNLTNGVTYYFTVYARDAAGNISAPAYINAVPGKPAGKSSKKGGCSCSGTGSLLVALASLAPLRLLRRRSVRR